MTIKIFYSWQSDLPDEINWNFIGDALENVAQRMNAEVESAERGEIEIDHATKNIKGTVSIADTILKKINRCDVFIADLSIIGKVQSPKKGDLKQKRPWRKTSNPNVLFELGYAWRQLGEERIITVINLHYGEFEDLPFDLRGKAVVPYRITPTEERSAKQDDLEKNRKCPQVGT